MTHTKAEQVIYIYRERERKKETTNPWSTYRLLVNILALLHTMPGHSTIATPSTNNHDNNYDSKNDNNGNNNNNNNNDHRNDTHRLRIRRRLWQLVHLLPYLNCSSCKEDRFCRKWL